MIANMTERLHTNRAAEDRRPRRTLRTTSPCSHRSATGSLCSVHLSGSPRGEGPRAPLSVTPKLILLSTKICAGVLST